ncbi:MAG: alpha/beta fold hydrolase [Anaerolineales bacterium]
MKLDSREITFEDWTLRIHPASQKPGRILLMLHGWTGDENSMWVFAGGFPKNVWMLAPRAPYNATPSGYSWRVPQPGGWPSMVTMRQSAAMLADLVERFAVANALDAEKIDVIGFSQGGAMAAAFALLYPHKVHRLGILAGFVPQGAEDFIAARPLAGIHAFVTHGTQDETVPIEFARRSVDILEQAGAVIDYCESALGHKVSAECRAALEKFLAG